MSVATITPAPEDLPEPSRPQGVFALPIVGPSLVQARDITEGLRPTDEDNIGQVVAKRTAQSAIIAAAAAVVAIAIL